MIRLPPSVSSASAIYLPSRMVSPSRHVDVVRWKYLPGSRPSKPVIRTSVLAIPGTREEQPRRGNTPKIAVRRDAI